MNQAFAPVLAIILAGVLSTPGFAGDPIPVNPEKELQVVVYDNVMPRARDSWTSPRRDYDRFLEFRSAVEAAIKAAGYQGPVKVTQFAANIPDAQQRLSVYIYRWETGIETFGVSFTAEFSMEAVLRVGDQEYGLGSFSARESHVAMSGPQPEDYRPVARRAIDQMIEFYRNAIVKAQAGG